MSVSFLPLSRSRAVSARLCLSRTAATRLFSCAKRESPRSVVCWAPLRQPPTIRCMSATSLSDAFEVIPPAPQLDSTSKLRQVLEDYRKQNFGQILFPRFIKEMIAAVDVNHDGKLSKNEIQQLLVNIGATEQLLESDIDKLLSEHGIMDQDSAERLIDIDVVEELILNDDEGELGNGGEM